MDDAEIRALLLGNSPCYMHSSVMVRRELLKLIGGYDERLPLAQDYDMYLRLLPHCGFTKLGTTLV